VIGACRSVFCLSNVGWSVVTNKLAGLSLFVCLLVVVVVNKSFARHLQVAVGNSSLVFVLIQ